MGNESSNLFGCKIVLGVTGSVAAYKAVDLASKLTSAGALVRTVMTYSAGKLVGGKSFEAVTGEPVFRKMWGTESEFRIGHINLVDWADMVVVAPATANIIAKTVNGICDDLLSCTLCAGWQKPVLFAPAMNSRMWENPVTRRNVEGLIELGYETVGPEAGHLACGVEGVGRMSEVGEIIEAIGRLSAERKGI
jgi:phosphopantothenoylcysteine decarboxylase/phosphopantothenate--cysteine ligase